MFVLFVSKDDGHHRLESARKAHGGAAATGRPKTPKVVKIDPDSDEQCCT
jgi:hypothetical protein